MGDVILVDPLPTTLDLITARETQSRFQGLGDLRVSEGRLMRQWLVESVPNPSGSGRALTQYGIFSRTQY